jgi:predicted  nucleic acid-binding Zn-ribbon protein
MGLRDEVAVLEVKDQLLRLVRLQEIAMEVRSARALMDGAPSRVEEIEAQFRERNEEHKAKYMADLMQVQNQREYAAMLKEIDAVKAQIAEHEEAILSDMEEIETVKVELATHEEHIKTERERVDKERSDVEAAADAARQSIATLEDERSSLENELPLSLVGSVRRLEESRQGQFLSKAEEGVCHSCFVRVRPQGFQEVKLAIKIHYCSNCRRLLYHEPTLKRMAAEAKGGEPGSNPDTTIEAADGGAV